MANTTLIPPFALGAHSLLWEKYGLVHDLGNLGGTSDPDLLIGNIAFAINNPGQVVGTSALSGNKANHAFRWTAERGIEDLGTLLGDDNI